MSYLAWGSQLRELGHGEVCNVLALLLQVVPDASLAELIDGCVQRSAQRREADGWLLVKGERYRCTV